MALIHGARGIDYFVHQFKPTFVEAALLQDEPMCRAIGKLNAQVEEFAPVLNAPAPATFATWNVSGVGSGQNASAIAAITRRFGGAGYVFAVAMSNQTVSATFHLAGVQGSLTAIGENRQIAISNQQWTDTFTAYQVHLYRIGPTGSD
jgi:FtsP/CotA-like multicopper oxidase with cupredoxin domain